MKQILWIFLLAASTASGTEWNQWRGPALNGTCDATNLPVTWSLEAGHNVAWTCDLPGNGQSTPIVTGRRIFLTSSDEHRLYGICIDNQSGTILWKKKLGQGRKVLRRGTMAHSSAVTDGKSVYFLFGQGTMAGFTVDGTRLWTRNLEEERGKLATKFGFSSSFLLHHDRLYLPLLYLADSKEEKAQPGTTLLIIDPKTGKTLQAVERPTPATKESLDSYITPIPGERGIILTGADLATSHDPDTGMEQWRFDFAAENRKTNWRIISSPVQAGELTVTAYPRGRRLVALKPDGTAQWEYEGYIPDVCTPAYGNGMLYVLDGVKRYLTCIDATSGREIWQEKIPSQKGFFASPLVADGKIYLLNLSGEIYIYEAGEKGKLIGRNALGADNSAASIIAVDQSLYIRLPDKLICAANN